MILHGKPKKYPLREGKAMKNKNDEFLSLYKDLENLIPQIGFTNMLDYENSIADINRANKLKLCRMIRNYLSHNSDGNDFIPLSSGITQFIVAEIMIVKSHFQTVKDILIPPSRAKTIVKTDTMDRIIDKFANYNQVIVYDENKHIIGMITNKQIVDIILNNKGSLSNLKKIQAKDMVVKLSPAIKFCKKDDILSDIDGYRIVTSDGTKDGIVQGIIREN